MNINALIQKLQQVMPFEVARAIALMVKDVCYDMNYHENQIVRANIGEIGIKEFHAFLKLLDNE